jgi:allophanate hydrolase
VVPACRSLDCLAAFAASPADAALVMELATGHDPDDPWTRPDAAGAAAWSAAVPAGRRVRVGVPAALPDADPATVTADAAARARMAALGWDLVEVDLGPFLAAGDLLYGGAFVAERYAAVGPAVEAAPAGLDPVVASIIGGSATIPAWRAFADIDRLRTLAAAAAPTWGTVDALALPTVPTTYTHAQVAADPLGTNRHLGTYTTFVNLLDGAAAVAPCGTRPDGHPHGVQLVGPSLSDGLLAGLAEALSRRP